MQAYKPHRSEEEEQAAVIAWAQLQAAAWPALRNLYHVPNEGKRGRAAAGMAKAAGLKPGVPDLVLDVPAGIYHGLRIEMKVHPNRPTKDQKDWLQRLQGAGYLAAVCYSAEAARGLITRYIHLKEGEKLTFAPECSRPGVPVPVLE